MRYLTLLILIFTTWTLPATVLADKIQPDAVLATPVTGFSLEKLTTADKIQLDAVSATPVLVARPGFSLEKFTIADKIQLDAVLATPVMLADKKQTAYLQVKLTGFRLQKEKIAPINVALVIDKSGSMKGDKMIHAKKAAHMVVDQLRNKDIIALISYDDEVKVMLPATKATDKDMIHAAINRLSAGGNTALFGGVEKGAEEVRKFLDIDRVNRIILVSDGQANVGPSSDQELGALGASLAKDNIAVTTFGLGEGYNEDLMIQLAEKSDGNHEFIENATDLTRIFNLEFRDLFAVVATDVNVTITCAEGIRPVRVLGREADIQGQQVQMALNQLYSEHQKQVLLEIEVPPTKAEQERVLAVVSILYHNMKTNSNDRLTAQVAATFTTSPQLVEEKTNTAVMIAALEQLAQEQNERSVTLRDMGKVEKARQLLLENAAQLRAQAEKYHSESLKRLSDINRNDAQNLDDNWMRQRKMMRGNNYKGRNSQRY